MPFFSFSELVQGVLARLTPAALLDILGVTVLIYGLLSVIWGTPAANLVRGAGIAALLLLVLGGILRLPTLNWLLQSLFPAFLVVVPVIFQPELRRALDRLGRTGSFLLWGFRSDRRKVETCVEVVVEAAHRMAARRIGALIVIERGQVLQEYADRGILLDARISLPLLLTIFFPNAPLHDGAVIVREDRLVAAACVLPLSEVFLADAAFGTRHRAALGISEQSDAVAVVVSEERGEVSLAVGGQLRGPLSREGLERALRFYLGLETAHRRGRKFPWGLFSEKRS